MYNKYSKSRAKTKGGFGNRESINMWLEHGKFFKTIIEYKWLKKRKKRKVNETKEDIML